MLRDAIAKAHGLESGQIFPRPSMDHLLAPIIRAYVGPEDHVALAQPCRPEFVRQVLSQGARYVDIGRDHERQLQHDALERLLADGALRALILGRPDVPAGTLSPLIALHQALHAGLLVVVDETQLAYALPNDGLPRATGPRSESALRLFTDDEVPTKGLIVLRSIPGLGPGEMLYAVAETETLKPVWSVDPEALIAAPLAAAAWLALDHSAQARRVIVARATRRAELRTQLAALSGFEVMPSGAASLMVRRPATLGEALATTLMGEGLRVATSAHPSWRDSVAISIPLDDSLDEVVNAFRKVAEQG